MIARTWVRGERVFQVKLYAPTVRLSGWPFLELSFPTTFLLERRVLARPGYRQLALVVLGFGFSVATWGQRASVRVPWSSR